MTAGAALLLVAGCAACAVPPRHAGSAEVLASAQRAVVVGVVTCERLWSRRALEGVVVELYAEGEAAPMAVATSGRDGVFGLASGFVATPSKQGTLRIAGRGWSGEALLVSALDQTYSVAITALCTPARPQGLAMLEATVLLQRISTAEMVGSDPMIAGHYIFYNLHRDL